MFVTAFFGERWWARRAELREFAILRREFEEREAAQEKNKNRLSALRAAASALRTAAESSLACAALSLLVTCCSAVAAALLTAWAWLAAIFCSCCWRASLRSAAALVCSSPRSLFSAADCVAPDALDAASVACLTACETAAKKVLWLASAVSNEGPSSELLALVPAVSWP